MIQHKNVSHYVGYFDRFEVQLLSILGLFIESSFTSILVAPKSEPSLDALMSSYPPPIVFIQLAWPRRLMFELECILSRFELKPGLGMLNFPWVIPWFLSYLRLSTTFEPVPELIATLWEKGKVPFTEFLQWTIGPNSLFEKQMLTQGLLNNFHWSVSLSLPVCTTLLNWTKA